MTRILLIPALAAAVPGLSALEPDGSRPVGIIPPYRSRPAPPDWLRGLSHALVEARGPGTRHYVYEAYGDGAGSWLVRYRHLPAAGEAPAGLQEAFLFGTDALAEPRALDPDGIRFECRAAWFEDRSFILADRRDLMKPRCR
jgi:hypothetical protein